MARGKQFLKERLHELLEVLHTVRAHVPGQSGLASVRASSQALVFWLAFVFSRLLSQGTIPSAWTFVREFVATDRKWPHIRRGREGGRLSANIIRDLIHERASASEPMCAATSFIRIATWRWRSKRRLACRCAATYSSVLELFCCG